MKQFDLEYQYQQYLKLVKLDESSMGAIQKKETKRAFYGACGQMLVLLRDELSELPENIAIAHLEKMHDQVGKFWLKETNKLN